MDEEERRKAFPEDLTQEVFSAIVRLFGARCTGPFAQPQTLDF